MVGSSCFYGNKYWELSAIFLSNQSPAGVKLGNNESHLCSIAKKTFSNKNTALAFPVVVNARFLSANVSKDGFSHGLVPV